MRSLQQLPDNTFIYPYSDNKDEKRKQIWENLEKGILFEDTKVFIPWQTPFAEIDQYAEQRKDSGDRTNWFLGKHQILDDYTSNVALMKWIFVKDTNPFSEVEEWLGFDDEGHEKFHFLKSKFIDLLGNPTKIELEKFGDLDLGIIEWKNKAVRIYLIGIEQHACKYSMHIGLIENKNK